MFLFFAFAVQVVPNIFQLVVVVAAAVSLLLCLVKFVTINCVAADTQHIRLGVPANCLSLHTWTAVYVQRMRVCVCAT